MGGIEHSYGVGRLELLGYVPMLTFRSRIQKRPQHICRSESSLCRLSCKFRKDKNCYTTFHRCNNVWQHGCHSLPNCLGTERMMLDPFWKKQTLISLSKSNVHINAFYGKNGSNIPGSLTYRTHGHIRSVEYPITWFKHDVLILRV